MTLKMRFIILMAIFTFAFAIDVPYYPEHEHVEHVEEPRKPPIPILKQSFQQHHEGYEFSYETGNGIHAKEQGYIKNKGDKKHETLIKQGTITYHDEHGHPITLNYVADEHGFHPTGAHLPTPPPIPEAILKSLEENAASEHQEVEGGHEQEHEVVEHQQIPEVYEQQHQQHEQYQQHQQYQQQQQYQEQEPQEYQPLKVKRRTHLNLKTKKMF